MIACCSDTNASKMYASRDCRQGEVNTGRAMSRTEDSPVPTVCIDMREQSVSSSNCEAVHANDIQLKSHSAPGASIVRDVTVPASIVLKSDLTMV